MATHRPKSRKPSGRPRPAHGKPKTPREPEQKGPERFRVLIAVNRPRYRSRSERAVNLPGWEVRSLLNKEDPIGLLNQKAPHILILSADFGRNKSLGFLKAAQKYRSEKTKIIGLFETPEEAEEAAELCDAAIAPPWKAIQLREVAARLYEEIRGVPAVLPEAQDGNEDDD
jgi:hypothetical protein